MHISAHKKTLNEEDYTVALAVLLSWVSTNSNKRTLCTTIFLTEQKFALERTRDHFSEENQGYAVLSCDYIFNLVRHCLGGFYMI